jgi:integrative and conjugative element protein (TIGR02256 family)
MPKSLKIALISSADVMRLVDDAKQKCPRETGGILMGYYSSMEECSIIEIIGPGPKARHGHFNFDPDYQFQEKEVAAVYEASGRRHSYLGDWHTHPRGSDSLSSMDRAALKQIGRSQAARCPNPLMLLVVGGPEWHLRLWQGTGGLRHSVREVALQSI